MAHIFVPKELLHRFVAPTLVWPGIFISSPPTIVNATRGHRAGGGEPAVSKAPASMALVLRELRPEGRRGP